MNPRIVLGKYARPRSNGKQFYVADWTRPGINPTTTYHEELIMAVAKIIELIETHNRKDF